ncbi:MAG: DHH family phosphoesterase [Methanoculleaceae archaeon]
MYMPEAGSRPSPDHVKYMILGCGSIGYNVVEKLAAEVNDLIIVDHDEKRVQDFRDQKYEAVARDMLDGGFLEGLPIPEVVFILSNNKDANLAAVRRIKERYPGVYVIARAMDPVSQDLLRDAGADMVIYPQELVARIAIHEINRFRSFHMARRLFDLLSTFDGALGIVTHTNPDPDAISSAMALAEIAREASKGKVSTHILYDGEIGHQENQAFVNLLEINMERIKGGEVPDCDHLALVDSGAPGSNNALPKSARVAIIIDHHRNGDQGPPPADFVDIRPGMGATATIMTQYLRELNIPVSKNVATALMYGIRADTQNFTRNISSEDLQNAAYLLPLTDEELLKRITSPSISQATMDVIGNAICNRKIRSGYLFSNVGYLRNRDALPQAADLLINLEGVNTALVYGICDDAIHISARNRDIRLHIGNVMLDSFGDIADTGGHATMAAAIIPLNFFSSVRNKDELLSLVIDPLLRRFTKTVGLEDEENGEE